MPRNRFCSRLIRQTSNGSGQRRIRYVVTGKMKIYKVKYVNITQDKVEIYYVQSE